MIRNYLFAEEDSGGTESFKLIETEIQLFDVMMFHF